MKDALLREFRITDYERVLALWRRVGLIIRPGDDLESIRLKLQRDSDLFLVSEENQVIIGVVMGAWDGRRGWINRLAIDPAFQRRGVATRMLEEVEARLSQKGAKKVNAQVYEWNERSLQFFKARGYEVHSDLVMVGKQLLA